VYHAILEALTASKQQQQQLEQTAEPSDPPGIVDDESSLTNDIKHCAEFFIGVPSVVESVLVLFLQNLYGGTIEHGHDGQRVDFRYVHRVDSIFQVAQLFPGAR